MKKKQLITILIYLLFIAVISGLGIVSGFFESVQDVIRGFNFDITAGLRLIIMVFFVLAVEKLILLIIGLFEVSGSRSSTIRAIVTSLIRYTALIVIICWGLTLLGVSISTVVASVGVVALIVGFGAESLIEDVITGVFMLIENQYNVGDIVEISGFRGTVTDIGIRTTSITDPGGNVKIINNSNMKDVLNRSDNASVAISDIAIPYETDLEAFEKEFPEMMQQIYLLHRDLMVSPPVYLGVQELGDSGVKLRFLVEVHEKDIYTGQRTLNRELFVFFRKSNVHVPYPQIDVHQK
ncbi:MAG: mechanosensitive ion channel family protein [Mogibacterium sp.]|nr:mechanosensitive ion channel family protein [Mogibacterium sp.]